MNVIEIVINIAQGCLISFGILSVIIGVPVSILNCFADLATWLDL